jgi:xanthine/uracil permease
MALYYMFTGLFASIKWIALAPFKLIMNLPEIILTVGRGVMFVMTAIAVVWFSPALLLKKLELDFLANVVGVILLIIGLTFFQYALKPMFLSYWGDFQETELWMSLKEIF